jgi:hypothetical protein
VVQEALEDRSKSALIICTYMKSALVIRPYNKGLVKSINLITGEIVEYISRAEASSATGVDISSISKCCSGKLLQVGVFVWENACKITIILRFSRGSSQYRNQSDTRSIGG